MKSYREIADKVFERRDKYLVAKKRKKKKIIKRTSATVCALVVLLGISAWHFGWFNRTFRVFTQTDTKYLMDNEKDDTELSSSPTTDLSTTCKTTAPALDETTQTSTHITSQMATTTHSTGGVTHTVSQWKPVSFIKTLSEHKYKIPTNGNAVDWVEENNILYIVFTKPNRYMAIDTSTGAVIKDVALDYVPAEIHLFGNELWVSYPSLKAIKIYNKNSFGLVREIGFEHEVGHFDVCGDFIVYSEKSSWSQVFKYNVKTKEYRTVNVATDNIFSRPYVLVDQTSKMLYIGENGGGASLYCFDFDTLELKSRFFIGYIANEHKMILNGGNIYWGDKRFDATDVSKALCAYEAGREVFYANADYVITDKGIYNQKDGQKIVEKGAKYTFSMAIINSSGNLVVGGDGCIYVVSKPFM